jgi:hypothetical protein
LKPPHHLTINSNCYVKETYSKPEEVRSRSPVPAGVALAEGGILACNDKQDNSGIEKTENTANREGTEHVLNSQGRSTIGKDQLNRLPTPAHISSAAQYQRPQYDNYYIISPASATYPSPTTPTRAQTLRGHGYVPITIIKPNITIQAARGAGK